MNDSHDSIKVESGRSMSGNIQLNSQLSISKHKINENNIKLKLNQSKAQNKFT